VLAKDGSNNSSTKIQSNATPAKTKLEYASLRKPADNWPKPANSKTRNVTA
jgi:hypothetical protein